MFPITINIGTAHYAFYEGLYFAIAILAGALLGYRFVKKAGLDTTLYYNLILVCILSAVVGGRLSHILFWQPGYYFAEPLRMLKVWEGGISITGGIIAGVAAGFFYCKRKKIEFFAWFAALIPAILIAQGIGRIGCFLNGDAYGIPTDLPWGMEFPRYAFDLFKGAVDSTQSSGAWNWLLGQGLVDHANQRTIPLHPTQLYEAIYDFACAAFFLHRNAKKSDLRLSAWLYLASFTLFRFAIEYIRGDREVVVFLGTSVLQFVFLAIGAACVVLALRRARKIRRA